MIIQGLPYQDTSALPTICRYGGCLRTAVKGSRYCETCEAKLAARMNKAKKEPQRYKQPIKDLLNGPPVSTTVYFIGLNDLVKIGRTDKYKNRRQSMQTFLPYDIEELAKVKAPIWMEEKLHLYLKKDRVKREWCTPTSLETGTPEFQ